MDRYLVLSQFRFHDSLDSKGGVVYMGFFCGYWVVYGVWTFSVGGWISWIRLENRANDECERLVGSDISIVGFLVIMYDMLRFIIRDVANKGFDSSLRTLMFTVCSKSVHERLESRFLFDLREFVSRRERVSR